MSHETRTWRYKSGLAMWGLRPVFAGYSGGAPHPLSSPDACQRWLLTVVAKLPALLGDFAIATKTEVATESRGEDACVVDLREPGAAAELQSFLQQNEDVLYVSISLMLQCEERDPIDGSFRPLNIDDGAQLGVDIWRTEDGTLDFEHGDPVRLKLELDVDIYAPLSWGWERDNRTLAARNAPRLSGLLRRIEHDLPAELMKIDAPDYPGMIGPYGFLDPDIHSAP